MEKSVDILNELNEISPLVAGIGRANVFTVPQGYFETVPHTVIACITNEFSAGEDVPAGYFDDLSNTILSKIEGTVANELLELSPFIAGIKKINPFEVPANYFETFAVNIEEQKMPAALNELNELHPFDLLAGYFDNSAANIISKAKTENSAKVIAIPKRRNTILKYAAAAVFTGLVTLGVYKYAGNNTVDPVVETASTELPVMKMDEQQFEETLNSLNEDDIVKYLEKNGSENDVATLISGIDEANLPDQEEYFTDDATLDNFLEDIELTN